jgi:hypothetical protein
LDTREIKAIVFGKQEEFVYDLCVENNHNYTIGQDRFLVHNSGKSVFACQKIVLRMLTEKNHKFLAVRKIYATLRTSCYAELKAVIERANIESYFRFNLSPMAITCKSTGSTVIFRGIDDPEKIKSISGITGIWVEEANELSEDEFDQLQLRLRGETANYKQTIVTFNPVVETHWLKTRYFDSNWEGVVRKKTTFLDNAFIGSEYASKLQQLKHTNPKYYRVYALGEWGKTTTGAEFYRNWSIGNVANNHYNADNPIHISFDFNVVPYCTALISQIQKTEQGYQLNIINELCLSYPKNNTQSLCQSILSQYHDAPKCYVYGDPAGNSRDTRSSGSDYTIIFNELKPLNPINKVASYAPRLSYRNIFTNLIMANAIPSISLAVSPTCKNLIKDFEEVTEAADGSKLKKRVTDKATGQSYEPIGHTSDAFDYLVCQLFKAEFNAVQGKKAGIYAG